MILGGRGGFGGGRGGGGRGGFGSGNRFQDQGPPETVIPLGYFTHTCQDELVCKVTLSDVPYFNAPVFLENKQQIGKIDEIFGTLKDYFISIKLNDDMKANSFKEKDQVQIVGDYRSCMSQSFDLCCIVNSLLNVHIPLIVSHSFLPVLH